MSKLVKCKSCGKEVAPNANACPHCGESNPGLKMGKGCLGCLGVCVIVIVLSGIIAIMQEPGDSSSKSDPIQQKLEDSIPLKAELSLSVEKFIDNFNVSINELAQNRNIRASIKDENDNGSALTIQLETANDFFSILLSANNESRMLKSVTLIGAGNGTQKSGVDIMFGIASVVMAFEDPYMLVDDRGQIVKDLGLTDGRFSKFKKMAVERSGVKYTLTDTESVGIWLIAEPI